MDIHKNRRKQVTASFKTQRQNARDAQRNLLRANLDDSCELEPIATKVEAKENLVPAVSKAALDRRAKMEQWRRDRNERRKAELKTQRPVFRVGRIQGAPAQTRLPPVKASKLTCLEESSILPSFQHVAARVDTGLKNLKVDIHFANTSKQPVVFTGNDKYLTSDEDPEPKDQQPKKVRGNPKFIVTKNANSSAAYSSGQSSKMEQKCAVEPQLVIPSSPPLEVKSLQTSEFVRTPSSVKKSARKTQSTSSKVTPDQGKPNRTPSNTTTAPSNKRRTPGPSKKRLAPEEELVTDDDSFSLGATPSGKVRRAACGKAVPVIRKSFEIKRFKTTEERVAALMNSPMVEFRRRKSGVDVSSPMVTNMEEDEQRRNSLLEMRAEVMEKVADDYARSPEGKIPLDGLPQLDPNSARKVRRKSRILQEAFVTTAQITGQPVAALSAQHFRRLLMDETTRLTDLRSKWEAMSSDMSIPSSAHAEIAATIGQTELLFRHKFFFYERMIAKHEAGAGGGTGSLAGRLVTGEDLLGYWEVMHLEIDNLDERYTNLQTWKDKEWTGTLADFDKAPAPAPRPARKKIVQQRKKPVTSKFAAFRAKLKKPKETEGDTSDTPVSGDLSGESACQAAPSLVTTPPYKPIPAPVLRSVLKSAGQRSRASAAVRFAAASTPPQDHQEDSSSKPRRPLTPFRNPQAASQGKFASPKATVRARPRSRSRSFSTPRMPADSPRGLTTPSPTEVEGRPKTGTPFPEQRSSSAGSRRRIAEIRSNAGLTLRTEEAAARRQSSSLSPPSNRQGARTRQSSVRFTQESSESNEESHPTMPVTPYNRSSLVPMARRNRPTSAPRSAPKATSSRVRFDSEASSPPSSSAPVTPFSKDSLVPLPRRHRQSSYTNGGIATPESQPPPDATSDAVTSPPTSRLVDVTPLRRSSRRKTNQGQENADVSLL